MDFVLAVDIMKKSQSSVRSNHEEVAQTAIKVRSFAELAPEIRLMIWEQAALDIFQVINVIENVKYKFWTRKYGRFWLDPRAMVRTDSKVPALFHVNSESRFVANSFWEISFTGMNSTGPMYFNFERDTLFAHSPEVLRILLSPELEALSPLNPNASESEPRSRHFMDRISAEEAQRIKNNIQNLIVAGDSINYHNLLEKFQNLRTLKITRCLRNQNLLEEDILQEVEHEVSQTKNERWRAPNVNFITEKEQMNIDQFFFKEYDEKFQYHTMFLEGYQNLKENFRRIKIHQQDTLNLRNQEEVKVKVEEEQVDEEEIAN